MIPKNVRRHLKKVSIGAILFLSVITNRSADHSITLTRVEIPWNDPVGLGYNPTLHKLIASVHNFEYEPYTFAAIASNGEVFQHSSAAAFSNGDQTWEVKLAVARYSTNGFVAGQLFAPTSVPGEIARISPDGQAVELTWAILKDSNGNVEPGHIRGLHVDSTGLFNNQLVVVTTQGGVWRVSSTGAPTLLARITSGGYPVWLEGVITAPSNQTLYGPWSGKLLAGAEDIGAIFAVSPTGTVTTHELSLGGGIFVGPEDIDIVNPGEDFYVANLSSFPSQGIYRASASDFASITPGSIIVTDEGGSINLVKWENNARIDS